MAIPNLMAIKDWCLSQFARKADIPTKTSDLDNDSKFVTQDGQVSSASKVEHALTFTGGVTGIYDGSESKTVAIPTSLPANGGDADTLDNFHASSFLGNETGYIYPNKNGGDANDYKTECHGFVFNMSNTPANYGFLDVSHFNGAGFTPSSYKPVVLQRFTHWDTGQVYTRIYLEYTNTWTAWKLLLDVPASNPVLSVANGGTGKTTANNAANDFLNALTTGSDVPKDNDYYISQYVNGGTATTTFHRRPVSKLWEYMKPKVSNMIGSVLTAFSIGQVDPKLTSRLLLPCYGIYLIVIGFDVQKPPILYLATSSVNGSSLREITPITNSIVLAYVGNDSVSIENTSSYLIKYVIYKMRG